MPRLTRGHPSGYLSADLDRGIEWCGNKVLETIPQRRHRTLPLALQLGLGNLFTHTDHVSCFVGYLQEKEVPIGHGLFHQGDCSDRLYFIESGQVTVFLPPNNGQTRRLRTLGAGMSLGEQSFYLGTPRQTSAFVSNACE
ncbi:MAG: cyclic nucleotide-binding domain-containing protein [Phormidesmis sp.]